MHQEGLDRRPGRVHRYGACALQWLTIQRKAHERLDRRSFKRDYANVHRGMFHVKDPLCQVNMFPYVVRYKCAAPAT